MTEAKGDTAIKIKPRYTARIGKVLSKSSSKEGFSTVIYYEPESGEDKKHGKLYFVVDIHSPSPLSPDIGYNLIDIVKEEYYKDLSKSPSQSFESALKAANEEFAAIAKEGEKSWIEKTNVIVAAISGNKLLAVSRGTTEMHLWRNSKIMNLSEGMYTPGETYKPEETLTNIIEGELKVGDKLIFSTAELFYYLSVEKLKRMVEANSPAEAAKEIASQLRGESDIYRTNVIISEFSLPELINTEVETAPIDNWVTPITEEPKKTASVKPLAGGFSVRKSTTTVADATAEQADMDEGNQILEDEPPEVKKDLGDMAQEIDMRDEEIKSEPTPQATAKPEFVKPKIKAPVIPKINYAQGISNVSQATTKLKNVATSPAMKKTGNVILRAIKYVGLVALAIVDLVVNLITDWVNDIKKRPGGNRILMITVGVLAVVVVFSTLSLVRSNTTRVSRNDALAALESAIQKRDAAKAAIIYEDNAKASTLLYEAYGLAEEASSNETTKEDAMAILAEVESQLDEVGYTKRFDNPVVLVDFATLASQVDTQGRGDATVNINDILVVGNDVYTYDLEYNKVYKYNDSRREAGIVNSLVSNEKKIKLGSMYSNELIFYTNPASIYSLDLNDNVMKSISLDTGDWNNANDLIAYTDKLYFLDSENNNIWKYKAVSEGYTKIAPFFEDAESLDLSGATDFAIDGDIYMVNNGMVNKYTIGQQVEFILRNVPEHTGELGSIRDIYTDTSLDTVYVLDPSNNRIAAFDKENGKYVKQYIFSGIENPQKIFVNEDNDSIWILSDTQVYRLEI